METKGKGWWPQVTLLSLGGALPYDGPSGDRWLAGWPWRAHWLLGSQWGADGPGALKTEGSKGAWSLRVVWPVRGCPRGPLWGGS